ncbi:hypothetical protein B296_00050574, partial [Ensete ventricosum]
RKLPTLSLSLREDGALRLREAGENSGGHGDGGFPPWKCPQIPLSIVHFSLVLVVRPPRGLRHPIVLAGLSKSGLSRLFSQELPHPSRYVSPPRLEGRTESYSTKPDKSLAEQNAVPSEAAGSNGMSVNGQDTGTSSDMSSHVEGFNKVVDQKHQKQLASVYNEVIVVDNVSTAKHVAQLLTTKYKNFIHACDTEVS